MISNHTCCPNFSQAVSKDGPGVSMDIKNFQPSTCRSIGKCKHKSRQFHSDRLKDHKELTGRQGKEGRGGIQSKRMLCWRHLYDSVEATSSKASQENRWYSGLDCWWLRLWLVSYPSVVVCLLIKVMRSFAVGFQTRDDRNNGWVRD